MITQSKKLILTFLSMLLIAAVSLTSFISCKSGSADTSTTTGGSSGVTTVATAATTTATTPGGAAETIVTDRNSISDNLPANDYAGYNFKIMALQQFIGSFYTEDIIGEPINDALYNARTNIEQRFNITMTVLPLNNTGADAIEKKLSKAIKSGTDECDMAFGSDLYFSSLMLAGSLVDVRSLTHQDFTKPWWPQNTVDALTFDGKMFAFSNSMTVQGMNWTSILFINKGMAQNLDLTVPYQDVFNGTWTLDKMTAMVKNVYDDVNGDSKKDGGDKYGYAFSGAYYCAYVPFGVFPVVKDGNTLKANLMTDRSQTMIDKLYDLMYGSSSGGTFYDSKEVAKADGRGTCVDMFTSGNALITQCYLQEARNDFRNSNVDYGILPIPKLDESQTNYYADCYDRVGLIPITNTDLDRTSVIIEAFSAEGWKKVYPAYYDISMKNKFMSDAESEKVLDLIFASRVLDFSFCMGISYGMFVDRLFWDDPKRPSTDLASYTAKNDGVVQTQLQKIMDEYNT